MNSMQRILITEDNAFERNCYCKYAEDINLKHEAAATLSEALSLLSTHAFDFLLTDIHLSTGNRNSEGFELIEYVQNEYPTITVLAMSSDPNVVVFERATSLGADHFLKKPILNADDLAIAIDLAVERKRTRLAREREGQDILDSRLKTLCPEGIVVAAEHVRVSESAAKNPDIPVVILGETGTGKEEIAKLIHRKRNKLEGIVPLVIVNCANLSEELLESALFGHKKGAFSGAAETTTGYIGEAHGGILFLDEIHTLSQKCQQKLLRVLNDGTYQRLGDTKNLTSKFQVLAATTRDLDAEVDAGKFLLDLRTRLTGLEIKLPPLRERFQDLTALVLLFFNKQKTVICESDLEKLVNKCKKYYWRGNIRQLFMALNVLLVTARDAGKEPTAEFLPVFKTMFAPESHGHKNKLGHEMPFLLQTHEAAPSSPLGLLGENGGTEEIQEIIQALASDKPFNHSVASFEQLLLKNALVRHDNNIAQMCMALRLGRSSFELKRKKYNLL